MNPDDRARVRTVEWEIKQALRKAAHMGLAVTLRQGFRRIDLVAAAEHIKVRLAPKR